MAEKAEKTKTETAAPAAEKKAEPAKPAGGAGGAAAKAAAGGGGLMTKTPVLLGGVMILEAAVLFAGFKFLGGGRPATAAGAELITEEKVESTEAGGEKGEGKEGAPAKPIDRKRAVEVPVLDFKAPNKTTGRTFLYDIKITILTKGAHQAKVEETIKQYQGLIQDRVRTIIAQSDPEKLGGASEPGLETLRRQVKYQLDEIIGEGLIDEVLVPRCIPFRTDY
jgi:flagellar basal body-associated protein FliL